MSKAKKSKFIIKSRHVRVICILRLITSTRFCIIPGTRIFHGLLGYHTGIGHHPQLSVHAFVFSAIINL
eukprot:Gb_00535 [translate_table: standard]